MSNKSGTDAPMDPLARSTEPAQTRVPRFVRDRVEEPPTAPLEGRAAAQGAKRVFDATISGLALLLLSPLLALIAIAIKLDTPGPILFRQRRIGRYGEPFGMLKFRTMVDGADERKHYLRHLNEAADGLFKINRDPRITRVGRLLRSTSFDELPQLVQVLTGEMSIVGPRPLIAEEDSQIRGADRRREQMRPGLTGPWQVAGSSKIPLSEMVKLDANYVDSWTLVGDLSLIVRTVPHVLMRRGV